MPASITLPSSTGPLCYTATFVQYSTSDSCASPAAAGPGTSSLAFPPPFGPGPPIMPPIGPFLGKPRNTAKWNRCAVHLITDNVVIDICAHQPPMSGRKQLRRHHTHHVATHTVAATAPAAAATTTTATATTAAAPPCHIPRRSHSLRSHNRSPRHSHSRPCRSPSHNRDPCPPWKASLHSPCTRSGRSSPSCCLPSQRPEACSHRSKSRRSLPPVLQRQDAPNKPTVVHASFKRVIACCVQMDVAYDGVCSGEASHA